MFHHIALPLGLAFGLAFGGMMHSGPAAAQEATPAAEEGSAPADTTGLAKFVGDEPPSFDDPAEVVAAFKAALEENDRVGMARLLGFDPDVAVADEDYNERFNEIKDLAVQLLLMQSPAEDRRILVIGREVWPFPFPIVRSDDGKWAFDTEAGWRRSSIATSARMS